MRQFPLMLGSIPAIIAERGGHPYLSMCDRQKSDAMRLEDWELFADIALRVGKLEP